MEYSNYSKQKQDASSNGVTLNVSRDDNEAALEQFIAILPCVCSHIQNDKETIIRRISTLGLRDFIQASGGQLPVVVEIAELLSRLRKEDTEHGKN